MPKKAGIGKKSSKLDWKKKRRQQYLELKKYCYYIFCEGEQTEPQYFAGFKRLIEDNPIYKDMVLIEIQDRLKSKLIEAILKFRFDR